MNKKELKTSILGIEIPEEIEQRLIKGVKVKQKRPIYRYKRPILVAACMMIIMLIGIPYFSQNPSNGNIHLTIGESPLIVKAYAATTDGEIEFEDMPVGTEIVIGGYSIAMSVVPGFPFRFYYPNSTIEVTVDNGGLITWEDGRIENKGNTHIISGDGEMDWGNILWRPFKPGKNDETSSELAESAIIDYVVMENGNIVGMGIIKISSENWFYTAELVMSIGFPKVDGAYQRVTEKDILRIREDALGE